MKQTFQAGVDAIYNAIVGQGTTPAGKTPAQLVDGISTMATAKYNAGNSAGYTNGYNAGVAAGSASYLNGIGADSGKTFTCYNPSYKTKAFLVAIVSNDNINIANAIYISALPGGTNSAVARFHGPSSNYGSANVAVFQLNGVPAGNITVTCDAGGGRAIVIIG